MSEIIDVDKARSKGCFRAALAAQLTRGPLAHSRAPGKAHLFGFLLGITLWAGDPRVKFQKKG